MRLIGIASAVCLVICFLPCKQVDAGDRTVNIMESGNSFLEACKHVDDDADINNVLMNGICLGFMQGFTQGATVTDEFHNTPLNDRMFCPDPQVTVIQYIRVVRKYIDAHPERAHMPTRYLASEAFITAFPCKK